MGYLVGSVVYCRPAGVVQRKVPSGNQALTPGMREASH